MTIIIAPNTANKLVGVSFNVAATLAKAAITLPTHLPDFDLKAGNPVTAIAVSDPTAVTVTSFDASGWDPTLAAGTSWYVVDARTFEMDHAIVNAAMIDICYQAAGAVKGT